MSESVPDLADVSLEAWGKAILGHPLRTKILAIVAVAGPRRPSQLAVALDITRPLVSQQIAVLLEAGAIEVMQELARSVIYDVPEGAWGTRFRAEGRLVLIHAPTGTEISIPHSLATPEMIERIPPVLTV